MGRTLLNGGYAGSETIIRSENPLLLQITSTPFYYRPVSLDSGGFDASGRYFYYKRQNDIALPAAFFRFDVQSLISEPVREGDFVPFPARMVLNGDESLIYDDSRGNTVSEDKNKYFEINSNGKIYKIYHGNSRGPAPETRTCACLSPDASRLAYFSNIYGPRYIFIYKF